MNSIKTYLSKIYFIIQEKKIYLFFLLFSFVTLSILDIVGISLVTAFMSQLLGSENFIFNMIKDLINFLNIYGDENFFNILIFSILVLYVCKAVASFLIQAWIIKFTLNFEAWLRNNLMKSYVSRPYKYFINENAGDIINVAGVYTNTFQASVLIQGIKLMSELIVISMVMIFLAINNLSIVLIIVTIFLTYFFIYDYYVKKIITKAGHVSNRFYGSIITSMNEAILAVREIKIFNKKKHFLEKINTNTKLVNDARLIQDVLKLIPKQSIELLLIIIVMIASFYFINFSSFASEEFVVLLTMFAAAGFRLLPALTQSISSINSLRSSKSVVSVIFDALNYLSAIDKDNIENFHLNKKKKLDFKNVISIENLNYQYEKNNKYILQNLDLEINKGDCIGIVGSSGAGKTTLINILIGLLDFDEGKIEVDNKIFHKESPLGVITSYIPQNIFLLDDTILRNITFETDKTKIDFELLNEAIKISQLESFINSNKESIYSIVGENGIKLSGGQRQRIALARAMYFKREIIILDEATSALDTITEKDVVESINLLKGKITIIIITHRKTALKNCDKVYQLNSGNLTLNNEYLKDE